MSRRRTNMRMNNAGLVVGPLYFLPFILLILLADLVTSLPSATAAAAAVPSHQNAFAAQSQPGPDGYLISGDEEGKDEHDARARDSAREHSRLRCINLNSDDNEDDDNNNNNNDCRDISSSSGCVDGTISSKSLASSDGQRDSGCGTVKTAQTKEIKSDPQSTSMLGSSSSRIRKIKRQAESSDNDNPDSEQGKLSSEMSILREELLGTLLARSSGNLDRRVVLRIADDAVRKLIQETAATAAAASSSAAAEGHHHRQTTPSSLVRLPPSMLAQDSEINLDEALQEEIRERAYRDRWWNPTASLPYMVELLSRAFPDVDEDDIIVMFAREAAAMVDEERAALDEVARTAFGLETFLLYDDEGMAMGSLLRQAMVEVRRNDLSVKELSALLRARYPPLMNFHRELVARTALYMVEVEDGRGWR